MNKPLKYLFLTGLLFLLSFSLGRNASAETKIADSANLLSSGEKEELQRYCNTILQQYDTSVYIVTSDTIGSDDDFEGYMETIGSAPDAPENLVLLFVSLKEDRHIYQIFGYGRAETYLTGSRCDKIMDHMQKDLTQREYFSALQTFCEETQRYLGRHPRFDSIVFQALPQLICSLLLSILVVYLILRGASGQNTTTVNTYIDDQNSRLLGHIDHFSHMTVNRVKKPSQNSGGHSGQGGGSGHSSGTPHSF